MAMMIGMLGGKGVSERNGPSERAGEMPRSAVCVEMKLPPIEEVEGNVAAWISQVRATYA